MAASNLFKAREVASNNFPILFSHPHNFYFLINDTWEIKMFKKQSNSNANVG